MKKTLKRMAAALIAATTMAAGMSSLSVGAEEYNASEPWMSRHVNTPGAPSSTGVVAVRSILYSNLGATCYCNSVSNTVNGGTGQTRISSVNGSMVDQYIVGTGSVICRPVHVGIIPCDTYQMSASTQTTYNTYVASGNIVARQ